MERNHPYKPLSMDSVESIHQAAMEVLSETGFNVHNQKAFELFKPAASRSDSKSGNIRLSEKTILDILSTVPSEITLYGRGPGNDCHLGSGNVYFGTGGTALNVLDYDSETARKANLKDLIDIIRIVDKMENIHVMLLPTYPSDIPVENVDVNRFFAALMHTSKHIMGGVYTSEGIDAVVAMAAEAAGSMDALRKRPFISMITCGMSPLILDGKYGDFMIQAALHGIPVAVPTEPLCGATAPMTLAGNLVIQNCDALISVMLTQLANPGAPVIYGCVATSTDMRDLGYLGGPVESGMLNAAAAQLTHYYKIPYYATAGISDSKVLDAQCGYESAVNNLLTATAGADFIHDAAGLMEFAMTVSKEKLVIDNEILGMALRAARGISVNKDTLALDVIKQVGPGGNFLTTRHTRKYMRKEHYTPRLSDRDKREVWKNDGGHTAAARAHEIVTRFLSSEIKPHLEPAVMETLLESFPGIETSHFHQLLTV